MIRDSTSGLHTAQGGTAVIGDVKMRSSLNFHLLLLLLHFAKAADVFYCDGVYQLQNRFPNANKENSLKANKENDLN